MDEKQVVAHSGDFWAHREFWTVTALLWAGLIAKALKGSEPFDTRKLAAEFITAGLIAVAMFMTGLLQGMATPQLVLFGALGALGTVRTLQWTLRLLSLMKKTGV